MELWLAEIGWQLPTAEEAVRELSRLLLAGLLGGLIGYDRGQRGADAGVRTHALVALGALVFTAASAQVSSGTDEAVKGIAAGVGFLGAGTILKEPGQHRVRGLTTAAGIWITAAVGLAVAAGAWFVAIAATVVCLCVQRSDVPNDGAPHTTPTGQFDG